MGGTSKRLRFCFPVFGGEIKCSKGIYYYFKSKNLILKPELYKIEYTYAYNAGLIAKNAGFI